jgi:hypothetical protein
MWLIKSRCVVAPDLREFRTHKLVSLFPDSESWQLTAKRGSHSTVPENYAGIEFPDHTQWCESEGLACKTITYPSRRVYYTCLISTLLTYSTDPSSNAGARLTFRVLRNQQSHWPPSCSSCSSLSCRPPTMLLFRGIVTCSPGACIQPPGSPSSPTFLNSSRTPRLESLPQSGSGNAGLRSIAVSTDTSTRVLLQHLITHSKVTLLTANFNIFRYLKCEHQATPINWLIDRDFHLFMLTAIPATNSSYQVSLPVKAKN